MGILRRRGWWGMARGLAALVGVGALVGGTALVELPAQATTGFSFGRLSGADRYATAAQIATQTFSTADTVVMATGENFPDALAGNYLAGVADVPILLTTTNLPVPPATLSALSSLKTKNVVLLGGTSAVSAAVQSQLASTTSTASGGGTLNVSRLSGTTRYDTMAAIDANAASAGPSAVGTFNGLKTAIVTTGLNFPDALSAGPIAFHEHFPIVLTDPTSLSSQASATLKALGIGQVIIEGGTAAVSSADESSINGMGITTLGRLAGSNRSQTSQASGDFALDNLGYSHTHFNVATGDSTLGGVDALAGGPHGGTEVAPTLVTNTVSDPGFAGDFATAHCATEVNGHIFGGTSAITPAAATTLASDAASCAAGPEATASTVAAAPTSVPANGTSTSTVTVTLVNNGKPVVGANVSLSAGASTHSSISAPSGTTNPQGAVFFTVSDTTPEVVTYTARDNTNNVTLAETATVTFTSSTPTPGPTGASLTATANPTTVAANGTATSTITVLVKNSAGGPVSADTILGSAPGGGCGTLTSSSATTSSQGVATFTYTAGTTAASCTVSFTDTMDHLSGSVTIGQGVTGNTVQVVPNPSSLPADGSSTSTVNVSLATSSGAPVANDALTASLSGGTGVCGSLSSTTATTDSSGKATFIYTAGKTTGTCLVTVKETAAAGSTGEATLTQTSGTSVSVTANPTSVKANGTATSAITATVASNQPIGGGTVSFAVAPAAGTTGTCGTLTTPTATLTSGATSPATVTTTYTAGTGTGFCTVTATFSPPAGSGAGTAAGSVQIDQTSTAITPGAYTITLAANPSSVVGNGTSTSTVTATVANASAAVPGDLVLFSVSGTNCGTITPTATTDGAGVATATYTASVGTGTCTITAVESASGSKATTTVTQTGPASLSVSANPSTTVAIISPNSTVTAVSTRAGGAPAAGDTVVFTVTGASLVTGCGSVSPAAVTTDANGVARTTYTDTVAGAIGTCTVTATDTTTGASSSTVISQLIS